MSNKKDVAIFDLCGVLVDWNPLYAYKSEIKDEARLKFFLNNICNRDFMHSFDEGRNLHDAVVSQAKKYPEYAKEISLFPSVRSKMFNGEVKGSVDIIKKLKNKGVRIYLLSNCAHENVPMVYENFKSLALFDGCVFSGLVKKAKPKPEIFNYLFDNYKIDTKTAVFVDDNPENVAKAKEIGVDSVLFTNPKALARDLKPLFGNL